MGGTDKPDKENSVSAEQGETSTILSFISGTGNVVPPTVIHKGVCVQDTWKLKAPFNTKIVAIQNHISTNMVCILLNT